MPVPLKAKQNHPGVENHAIARIRRSSSFKLKTKVKTAVAILSVEKKQKPAIHLGTPFRKTKLKVTKCKPFTFEHGVEAEPKTMKAKTITVDIKQDATSSIQRDKLISMEVDSKENSNHTASTNEKVPIKKRDIPQKRYRNLFG